MTGQSRIAEQNIERRNARLVELQAKLNTLARKELDRIDRQVAFLRAVQRGRGAGRLKSREEAQLRFLTEEKVSDFLGS